MAFTSVDIKFDEKYKVNVSIVDVMLEMFLFTISGRFFDEFLEAQSKA